MTNSMVDFVEHIKDASRKSTQSTIGTIEALNSMTDKINNVWELNNENQSHVSQVNESISSIATVSQEISSSLSRMEEQLQSSTHFMQQVGNDLKQAVQPVVSIEKTLDDTVKQMGRMTEDPFFHLENQEFAKYVKNAITAHHTWLTNLEKMVHERRVLPLQLNPARCGFGHFYYAITPQIPEILPVWENLEYKHKRFHKYGEEVILAFNSGHYDEAEQICHEARTYSRDLISDLEQILQAAGQQR